MWTISYQLLSFPEEGKQIFLRDLRVPVEVERLFAPLQHVVCGSDCKQCAGHAGQRDEDYLDLLGGYVCVCECMCECVCVGVYTWVS